MDDNDTGPDTCAESTDGLSGARGLAVSPDGKSVYVGSQSDDAVVRFDRDPVTGALTPAGCIDDNDTVSSPGQGEDICAESADGLWQVYDVTVSPEGNSVYATSGGNDNAVVSFSRDTQSGALAPAGCIDSNAIFAGDDTCAQQAPGLGGAHSVTVSPDAGSVYVTGSQNNALQRFDRAPTTGALTPAGCVEPSVSGFGICDEYAPGLGGPRGAVVSPDGSSLYVAGGPAQTVVTFGRADPPETTIDTGPSGPTNNPVPTFTFSADEPGSSFECRIDTDPFGPCSEDPDPSHTTASLADGPHTFEVRATDTDDNTDPTPASRSFKVDTVAPETTIISGPEDGSTTNDNTPTFGFVSSEPNSSFECRAVGLTDWESCTTPFTAPIESPDGTYTIEVRAKDAAGNVDDLDPAQRTITIDTLAPETTIDSGPDEGSIINDDAPSFTFSSRGSPIRASSASSIWATGSRATRQRTI